VSLKSVTLSTLYGLSVVIIGHPNAELSFKNGFPLSFPRILKDNGFKTAFIRGAKEDYMNEDKIFNSAGFEEIYGAKYFARQAAYSPFVAWWGLTDRKLFDFAVEYLKRHKNDKVFINLMTVDTHVPLGRDDYLGQEYPALNGKNIPEDITNLYKNVNMARAFFRFDYDLNLFIENLKKEGLLDGRTLLVITGDHPVYANMDAGILFKDYKPVFDELPLILITEKPIEERAAGGNLLSQQDIAPTILALAGFAAPRGMFGRSVFENAPRAAFNVKDGYALITASDGSVKFLSSNSKEPQEKALTELINTIIVD
jgi:phosphoglycerol transferase MdoB-like AlkP superfamily enzyme